MSNPKKAEGPTRNITWQIQLPPEACKHEFLETVGEGAAALKRCIKCGSLEAK